MATSLKPVIDYTNKDYASLRRAMLELASYRLPEWTDQSPGDLGTLLVDLFAYMGDVVLYYQDRIANESFLHTAVERRSVMHLLRLVGYELKPPVAASADLVLSFKVPAPADPKVVTILEGAQFTAQVEGLPPETFEYLGSDLPIHLDSDQVKAEGGLLHYAGLPVRHSRRVAPETLGSSTGEPNQSYPLGEGPLIPESLVVEVNEGADWVRWERRDTLLYHVAPDGRVLVSDAGSRVYHVQFDEEGRAWVVFGDGVYGRRPPPGTGNVRATYRVGGGTAGNVPAGAIRKAVAGSSLLVAVRNPRPAAGGAAAESAEHGVRFGPLAFRSGHRAVTLGDYVALAHRAGGVAKVRARAAGMSGVQLFVAPEGDSCRPVPDDLRKRLIAYFEDKRMAGTVVDVLDSVGVEVDVTLETVVAHHHDPEAVRRRVEATVRALLAFERVDFGQTLYLSKVYEAVEALDGVHAVTVTRFRRRDRAVDVAALLAQLGVASVDDLPAVVRTALVTEVAPEGRIDMGDFEIPTLGELLVVPREVGA